MQLVKSETSSHWYELKPDGQVLPQYEATLREARKFKYFISPTSIEKDIMANPTLARWIKNEIAKAFCSTIRGTYETDEMYSTRCMSASDEISKVARERGVQIHSVIENHPVPPQDPALMGYFQYFDDWYKAECTDTIANEIMLADPVIGVAGRVDKIVNHKIYGPLIIDAKTQNIRKAPVFYNSFPRQLSFYATAYARKLGLKSPPRIMSVVIDSNKAAPVTPHLYSTEEQAAAYREFLCMVYLWQREKGYYPGSVGEWSPEFPKAFDL